MLRSQLHDAPLPRRSPQALLSSDRSTQTDPDRVTVMDSFWLSKIRASERRSMAQVAPPPSTTLAAAMDIEDATEEGSAASVVHEQRAPQPQRLRAQEHVDARLDPALLARHEPHDFVRERSPERSPRDIRRDARAATHTRMPSEMVRRLSPQERDYVRERAAFGSDFD